MKTKLILLFILSSINFSFCMEDDITRELSLKYLRKKIELNPDQETVQEIKIEMKELGYFSDPDKILRALKIAILSHERSPEIIKAINKIMIYLTYPQIKHSYGDIFLGILNNFKAVPIKNLLYSSSWQILNIMPDIYNTIRTIEPLFIYRLQRDAINLSFGPKILKKYFKILAKIIEEENAIASKNSKQKKEILLSILIQKLGSNIKFLNFIIKQKDLILNLNENTQKILIDRIKAWRAHVYAVQQNAWEKELCLLGQKSKINDESEIEVDEIDGLRLQISNDKNKKQISFCRII